MGALHVIIEHRHLGR